MEVILFSRFHEKKCKRIGSDDSVGHVIVCLVQSGDQETVRPTATKRSLNIGPELRPVISRYGCSYHLPNTTSIAKEVQILSANMLDRSQIQRINVHIEQYDSWGTALYYFAYVQLLARNVRHCSYIYLLD